MIGIEEFNECKDRMTTLLFMENYLKKKIRRLIKDDGLENLKESYGRLGKVLDEVICQEAELLNITDEEQKIQRKESLAEEIRARKHRKVDLPTALNIWFLSLLTIIVIVSLIRMFV